MGQTLPSWGQGEGSHQYQYRSVNCRYPVIKRAIIAINKTVNIITQYNTSHYTCQEAGKRGYICLRPALWQGKHIQRKGSYQRYWPHRDLCRSTDYNWNRGQMVENIEYWSDSFLVPENNIVSKFLHILHQNHFYIFTITFYLIVGHDSIYLLSPMTRDRNLRCVCRDDNKAIEDNSPV